MPSAALPLGLVKTSYWAIGREDHGLELAGFLLEHRFALGLGAEAAKAVLGFCGGDAHGGLPGCLAILAIIDQGRKAVRHARRPVLEKPFIKVGSWPL